MNFLKNVSNYLLLILLSSISASEIEIKLKNAAQSSTLSYQKAYPASNPITFSQDLSVKDDWFSGP